MATRVNDSRINAVSGATAGVLAGIAVCPLDVVKTMLQTQGSYSVGPNLKYRGIIGSFRTILMEDGIRGLYRGLTPMVLGYIPTWAIYFTVYGEIMQWAAPTVWGNVAAAVSAGACSTIVTNPIWVVKTRLMSQNRSTCWHYGGLRQAFRNMYREEGLRVFYSGLAPALLGLPHVAIQFPLYERIKARLIQPHYTQAQELLSYLGASVISKICASTITYPHEVIRSRNQIRSTKYKGVVRTVSTLFREEGISVFYAGLGTNICRAVPASAVTLLTYEFVSQHLKNTFLDLDMDDVQRSDVC